MRLFHLPVHENGDEEGEKEEGDGRQDADYHLQVRAVLVGGG